MAVKIYGMRSKIDIVIPVLLLMIGCTSGHDGTGDVNPITTYPSFGAETTVIINGLTFDAMEPFLSPDGTYLFFNNLNDGINTKLFYAIKEDDTTFTLVGELNGPNQMTTPYLDAVADMDSDSHFYWTSTRGYPDEPNNMFHGIFENGNVNNIGRVRGDFYRTGPGWLAMDHGISLDGQFLYFNNARFDITQSEGCSGPCETEMGVAKKINDTTFNKLPNGTEILRNINDMAYNFYAPCISGDHLELYYTRYPTGPISAATQFEVCVAVRNSQSDNFSVPEVLFSESIGNLVEAPTLTVDKQIMYYHKKVGDTHKIFMRRRETR